MLLLIFRVTTNVSTGIIMPTKFQLWFTWYKYVIPVISNCPCISDTYWGYFEHHFFRATRKIHCSTVSWCLEQLFPPILHIIGKGLFSHTTMSSWLDWSPLSKSDEYCKNLPRHTSSQKQWSMVSSDQC